MNLEVNFPDAKTIKSTISNHQLLGKSDYQQKGITQAVAELAAERFTNCQMYELEIGTRAMLIVDDLRSSEDSVTRSPLPDFRRLGLSDGDWVEISEAIEQVLLNCAAMANNQ